MGNAKKLQIRMVAQQGNVAWFEIGPNAELTFALRFGKTLLPGELGLLRSGESHDSDAVLADLKRIVEGGSR